jgi:hypothetical protein
VIYLEDVTAELAPSNAAFAPLLAAHMELFAEKYIGS